MDILRRCCQRRCRSSSPAGEFHHVRALWQNRRRCWRLCGRVRQAPCRRSRRQSRTTLTSSFVRWAEFRMSGACPRGTTLLESNLLAFEVVESLAVAHANHVIAGQPVRWRKTTGFVRGSAATTSRAWPSMLNVPQEGELAGHVVLDLLDEVVAAHEFQVQALFLENRTVLGREGRRWRGR